MQDFLTKGLSELTELVVNEWKAAHKAGQAEPTQSFKEVRLDGLDPEDKRTLSDQATDMGME
jgi:hypothetical protein